MAAPLVSSAKGYNASATSIAVNSADLLLSGGGAGVPVSGDYLLFFCNTDTGTATITPPGGLTAFGAQLNTDGAMNARAWYLALSGSPAATYTFTHDGAAGPFRLDVVCVKPNGNTFSAIAVSQVDTAAATSLASTGVTGGADERVLVIHWCNDGEVRSGTAPAGMTLLQSQGTDNYSGYTYMETGVGTGSQSRTETFNASESIAAFAAILSYTSAPATSAATTGTLATGTKTQADVKAGGQTIILTLTGDTYVASGATFDAQRQAIINGLTAASSPSTGWNTLVRDTLAVTTVVRTSATVCTITLPAVPLYAITADEVITCTIPAAALTLASPLVSSPTITVNEGAVLSAYSGTTNGSGVLTTNLTSDQSGVRVLTTAYVGATVVGRTTTRPT